MKVQTATRMIRLQDWARQINMCRQSGKSVKQWCAEQGVNEKTYYYRLKRVQEEMLEALDLQKVSSWISSSEPDYHSGQQEQNNHPGRLIRAKKPEPEFIAFPMPQERGTALTVRMGAYAIDVHSGVDEVILEQVLRTVSRL
jgi:hypothetical protein